MSRAITALHLGLLASLTLAAPNPLEALKWSQRRSRNVKHAISSRAWLEDIAKRQDNATDICSQDFGPSNDDWQMRQRTWEDTGAGKFLDEWLLNAGTEDNWVQKLDGDIWDTTSTLDCTSIEAKCDAPDTEDCRGKFADTDSPEAFWVFVAIGKANNAWKLMHEKSQTNAITDSLSYDDLLSLFAVDEPASDVNIASILSSAFVLGSAATGFGTPAAAASLTLAIGSFSLMAALDGGSGGVDPEAALRDQLTTAFTNTQEQIQFVLDTAFGGGDTASLPDLGSGYETATANWFSDGRWLISDSEGYVNSVSDEAFKRQKQGLIGILMRVRHMISLVDTTATSSDGCTGKSNVWIEEDLPDGTFDGAATAGQCYRLYQPIGGGPAWEPAWDDFITTLEDDYGVDFYEVHKNAWLCGHSFPDGDGKVAGDWVPDMMGEEGQVPECFWNIPILRGERDGSSGMVDDPDINTVTGAYGVNV
jgi:hypothetical protein